MEEDVTVIDSLNMNEPVQQDTLHPFIERVMDELSVGNNLWYVIETYNFRFSLFTF